MPTITVYTKTDCQPCRAVKRWLDKRGIPYTAVDVEISPADLEAIKALGYKGVPVTVVSTGDPLTDLHWQGFNPVHLNKYAGAVA